MFSVIIDWKVAYFFFISQEKLSEEELKERMARIREQNEKIKQRRLVSLFSVNLFHVPGSSSARRTSKPTKRPSARHKRWNVPGKLRAARSNQMSTVPAIRTQSGSWTKCKVVNGTRENPQLTGTDRTSATGRKVILLLLLSRKQNLPLGSRRRANPRRRRRQLRGCQC